MPAAFLMLGKWHVSFCADCWSNPSAAGTSCISQKNSLSPAAACDSASGTQVLFQGKPISSQTQAARFEALSGEAHHAAVRTPWQRAASVSGKPVPSSHPPSCMRAHKAGSALRASDVAQGCGDHHVYRSICALIFAYKLSTIAIIHRYGAVTSIYLVQLCFLGTERPYPQHCASRTCDLTQLSNHTMLCLIVPTASTLNNRQENECRLIRVASSTVEASAGGHQNGHRQ